MKQSEFSPEALDLPIDLQRPALRSPLWNTLTIKIPRGVMARLDDSARVHGCDLAAIHLAAYAVFLGKLANARDFAIGLCAAGDRALPIAVHLEADEAFFQLATRLSTRVSEAKSAPDEPPIFASAALDPARNPLFDAAFGAGTLQGDLHLQIKPGAVGSVFELSYDARLFSTARATSLSRAFSQILRTLALRDHAVGKIPLLSEDDEAELLGEFSTPSFNWGRHLVLHELFEAKVDQTPDATALVFCDQRLSYAELDARANRVAHALVRAGLGPDAIIALVQERTPEMIVAILGVLKAGAAYLPIEPDLPRERVDYLLSDSAASAVLTISSLRERADHPQIFFVDELQHGEDPSTRIGRRAEPNNLAYVIYTSGSTGQPKGVLIEHRNVVHFVLAEKDELGVRGNDALILLSSYSFDASIDQIWLALSGGGKLVLVEKEVILDPLQLARLIEREQVTHLDSVPALLGELDPASVPSVKRVVVGGETCPIAVAQAWSGSARFFNEYGPTETTVGSLRQLVEPGAISSTRIPIGRPIGMTRAYVLDWGGCVVPAGVRGELHLGGAGVARGYLNREPLTKERFLPDPFALDPAARMYRTGDVVAWLDDGSVEFFGRADSQIKLRGFRIELGEIEAALLAHPEITFAAASVISNSPQQRLVCHFVATQGLAAPALRAFLARSLPAYMVPDQFMQLDAFPRTVSGKIDRKRLPAPAREGVPGGSIEAPTNQVETEIRALWSELLSLPAESIDVARSFFELGGQSLLVMKMAARLQQKFRVALEAGQILATPTIRAIAAAIAHAEPIPTALRITKLALDAASHALPATSVQRRLYVIQQGNPRSTSYNLPLLYRVEGALSEEPLTRALLKLLERHESLRTAFFFQEGEILQKIAQSPRFKLERFDVELVSSDEASAAFVRPFFLENPPLFRAAVFVEHGQIRYLALDMHHIVADGTSIDALLEDLLALLRGDELTALPARYFDYANWLASEPAKLRLNEARAYWSALLREELPVLELPHDSRRPLSRQQSSGDVVVKLDRETMDAISAFARAHQATPFAFFAAIYSVFLSCLTGSADTVFGFPTAARVHSDFERVVGMFVNTLVFRGKIAKRKSFAEYLSESMAQLRDSLRNEEYPFEELVSDLRLAPVPGRNPIFDTMLSFEGRVPAELRAGDAVLREQRLSQRLARMDLVLVIRESDAGYSLLFEYSADLFKRSTVERFAREFTGLVSQALAAPETLLTELHTLSKAGREQILHGFNDTAHALPKVRAVHELFEQHAAERPSAIAVEMGAQKLSYAEVDSRANGLAKKLRSLGVGRDVLVGILLDPCVEMLVAMLAVMKSGGAFLPIDPDYPFARKAHMLKDSQTRVLLSRGALANELGDGFALSVLDLADAALYESTGVEKVEVERSDLAYVIYTSGSTGLPKGALIEHRGLLNFSSWYANYFRIQPGDGVSKYAGFGFDASILEMVPAFIAGARLVIVPAEDRLSIEALDDLFSEHQVSIAFLPTQFGEQFLRHAKKHQLKTAFLGGEKLRQKPEARCEIINGYGPTEYTVVATAFRVDKSYDNIPIGKPLWNTQILILDRLGRVCPIGVAGELCMAGASIARGYLNQAALTAEKFAQHPFEPGRRIYRSGDLARWMPDGNVEFLGRIDTQVKVRGFRVELGEIEQALMALDEIREATVLARENPAVPGDLSLVAFVTTLPTAVDEGEHEREAALKAALARTLPAYMIPARIVRLAEIPLTANGKVDKRALPQVELDLSAVVAPRTETETLLRAIYAEVLAAPEATISVEASFLELGGHSLKAAVLLSTLYARTGFQLRLAKFLAASSIAEVARELDSQPDENAQSRAEPDSAPVWESPPEGQPLPLTSSQRRIYAVHQLSSWSCAYNIPFAWELGPKVDLDRLASALQIVFARHEALRASFTLAPDGTPEQRFIAEALLGIERIQTDDANLRVTLDRFVQPFDLARAPLMRAAFVTTEARTILAIDLHHIVADGLSVRVLVSELDSIYRGDGGSLAEPSPSFADYVWWEASEAGRAARDAEKSWWLERFLELPDQLQLPCDFDRPPRLSFEGDEVSLVLPQETSAPLLELARARNITPLGVYLSAWAVVLSRLGNTPDVVIGVPAAGRHKAGMEKIVGMFVNTVPLRLKLRADEPFSELCVRIGREAAEAFDRQSFQLNDLITSLSLSRDPSRNPLFDVLFSWEDEELANLESPAIGLKEIPMGQQPCKFDLELTVQSNPDGGGQRIALLFSRKLFQRATAERFIGNLRSVLEQAGRTPDSLLRDFRMLQPWEREMLLEDFNKTEAPVPLLSTVVDLFLAQVAARPNEIAVEDAQGSLTFEELDAKASVLAAELIARGLRIDQLVAISMQRTCNLLVAILGVQKSGAGYLPIDPETPSERAQLIFQDSRAALLVSDSGSLGLETSQVLDWKEIDFARSCSRESRATPRGIAYVIYTSGSTGKPKGVVLEHRNVVNMLETSRQALAVTADDRILLFSSFTFDASIEQYGLALISGARLVIPSKETLLDHDAFEELLISRGVTHLDTVPLFLSGYTPKRALPLRRVVAGGDICPIPVAARWAKDAAFFNEYGPTETTITSIRHRVTVDDLHLVRLPVGRPIANSRVYILDWTGNVAPLGVPGEMYIGGKGVARGYLNNEQLTRERFLESPFVPGDRLYRTGDIARWTADGTIDFLGRADNQVKIRGFRIELGEIEAALLRHPSVAEAAVVVLARQEDSQGEKRLCAYVVLRSGDSTHEVRSMLSRTLPSYMVPDAVVALAALPVTSSGKIDRKRLPEPSFEEAAGDEQATPAEEQLIEIWSEVLKLPGYRIPLARSFFELGGHSLLIMILITRIQQAFSVRLMPADVFDHPTIEGLARLIEEHERQAIVPIPKLPERERYPLSSVQRRLFAIHQANPQSVSYNMPTVFTVEGKVTRERLEEVVRALIHRHASLRTSFELFEGTPCARVFPTAPFSLETMQSDEPLDALMQRLMQPFDLAQPPLLRVWLVRRSDGASLVVADMHHIMVDGYSTAILWREVSDVIRGVSLKPLRIHCGDFAAWQESPEHRFELLRQRDFWLAQFATMPPALHLPYDLRRPAVRSNAGDLVIAQLTPDELHALSALSKSQDSTLFATLLSCFFIFLSRIGNADDLVVGVPVSGRVHPDVQELVGMFVNTVPWRARVPETGSFLDFLASTKQTSLGILSSEEYPLEELLEELGDEKQIQGAAGHNPLFDVMFVFETGGAEVVDAGKVQLRFKEFSHHTAKMDLVLIATESAAGLELAFEYATELFERATVERLAGHFQTLLRSVLRDPKAPLASLELLEESERSQLIHDFNDTEHELPQLGDRGVHSLFETWAERTPDAPAVIFGKEKLTYAQVDAQANTIASWLVQQGVQRNDVVAILLDPCAAQLPAILGVLKAGAAFLPVDAEYPAGRKSYMLEDSGARALLTKPALASEIAFSGPRFDLTTIAESRAGPAIAVQPSDAAYVIYTSGSTGKPKGVVIEHEGLLNFALWYADYYEIHPGDGVSKYAGFSFDASISEIFPACLTGAVLVVVPAALRLAPRELSAYFEETNTRVAFLPTAFGEQFLRMTENRSLRAVALAGEKLRAFRPAPWKIVNGYGPTEYTVCTSAFVVERPFDNIPIGKPVWNTQVLIVDSRGRLCPIGVAGELCVSGKGIARGYLNRPELTAEKFSRHPFTTGERCYRTGDLARWLPDGNLEFLGRIDSQVKVRGFRVELGEIEQTLLDLPEIKEAAVIDALDDSGTTYLIAYVVAAARSAEIDETQLRAALAKHLPDYMIPAHFAQLESLPLTPNGKVDRKALPAIGKRSEALLVAAESDLERKLIGLWANVLGLDAERIGATSSFLALGGHSLKAIALTAEIYRAFQAELRVSDIFRHPTVRGQAKRLAQQLAGSNDALGPIGHAPPSDSYPASSVQARMFLLQQLGARSCAYNVAGLFAAPDGCDHNQLSRALAELAFRHDAFRSSFFLDGQDLRLRVLPSISLPVPLFKTTEAKRDETALSLVQPFDLAAAPLARAAWLETERARYLFFDMHHICTDGASMALLVEELEQLLRGERLGELPCTLVDCAVWEKSKGAAQEISRQRDYWKSAFADGVPALGLLTDFPRPTLVDAAGETITRALPPTTLAALRSLCAAHGLSLHALLLAAFNVFLARHTRQEEIAVGTVVSGRWHPDMRQVFGMFVNTLVLKNRVDGKQPFLDFAREVAQRSIEALDHQAYPFSELVELLGDGRHAGHTPLFDVMFAMQNAEDQRAPTASESLRLKPVALASDTSKFDLSLVADESADALSLSIEYRTSLFKRTSIERFLRSLEVLLADLAARPETACASLSILSEEDRQRVYADFNQTAKEYPDELAAHRMFEKAAAKFPDRRALVQGARSFTYAEVDAMANRLAHRLIARGVAKDSIVAILTPPSCELIIAELAALKAGGAFLPLDHRYPLDRLEYTLRDSAAQVLIAADGLDKQIDWPGARLVLGPDLFAEGADTTSSAPALGAAKSDLAYVIYTSGSTGRPKGVAVEHASLVPFIQRTIDFYGLSENDRHSKYAGIGFDVSIIETFPPLCRGAELHIVPEEIRLSPPEIARWLNASEITWMDLPTQLAEEFISVPRETKLRWLTVGGDRLRRYTKTDFKLANEYGPTEFTVSATTFVVAGQAENIPIGQPTANTRVYILDASGQLCPPGVPGEICLAGKGLTRGYLGNPELTAKKYVQSAIAGGRMYLTGDLGRWLEDGNIEFLGRIDSQVKIRGFRIELGEIEQALLEVPGISRAVVIDRADKSGDKFLCGYFVASGEVTEQQIREALARRLPDYMVPPALMRLAAIPFSTSGKVDLRRLPEPEFQKREHVAVAPANIAQALIVEAFARVLGRSDLGIDDDFFDFGGNSLKAVTVVASLASDFRITANDLFKLRTARAIARDLPLRRGDLQLRLSALVDEIRTEEKNGQADPLAAPELRQPLADYRARVEGYRALPLGHAKSYRDILLTGATGFLGSYLLRDLLVHTDAKIYVAVRAKKRREAWDRLAARASHYFGPEMLEKHRRRVILVPGDLAQPQLGLDRGAFDALGRTLDCVLHTAALTKHYGDYSAFASANVEATQNVIALARQAGCDFNLVSTISVGLGAIAGRSRALFTELDSDIGQVAPNHYVRTKLLAEQAALELRKEGLVANIFRVGFLTGDSQTLRFQENAGDSGFVQTLRSYIALGRMPLSALTQSFCPVNEVSAAILQLMPLTGLANETHHIDRVIEPDEAERILRADPRCAAMDDASFFAWLGEHLGDPGVGQAAAALLLHEGLLDESPPTETVTLREKTALLLGRLGFAWSPVSHAQVWSLAEEEQE